MIFRGIGSGELFGKQVVADKERIHSHKIATNETIVFFSRELLENLKAGSEVGSAFPTVVGVVILYPRNARAVVSVVFHHNDSGTEVFDRLPYPVVIAVNVDLQQIEIFRHVKIFEVFFNVFCSDKGLAETEMPRLMG